MNEWMNECWDYAEMYPSLGLHEVYIQYENSIHLVNIW